MERSEALELELLRRKLKRQGESQECLQLVNALEFMPLSIIQAASYIRNREPRYSVSQYLRDFLSDRKATKPPIYPYCNFERRANRALRRLTLGDARFIRSPRFLTTSEKACGSPQGTVTYLSGWLDPPYAVRSNKQILRQKTDHFKYTQAQRISRRQV